MFCVQLYKQLSLCSWQLICPCYFGLIFTRASRWLSGKESACQCRRDRRRVGALGQEKSLEEGIATKDTPIFPGRSHGQRSLAGYSPWGHKESQALSTRIRNPLSFPQDKRVSEGPQAGGRGWHLAGSRTPQEHMALLLQTCSPPPPWRAGSSWLSVTAPEFALLHLTCPFVYEELA